ncbi:MAG: 16S rRNA (guanine(527)-N(7))-methyltransferase RsmG [Lachnospiraceae bacterium]|nr:16S rRNA (guanine(527)-N(7))-methyltransferase RsmG [Lachnospiraceae bacterium]
MSVDKVDTGSLIRSLDDLGIRYDDKTIDRFLRYHELLCEWNSFMNLTSITEWQEVVNKHFVDSLSLVKCVNDMTDVSYKILDIGTGAGFPGIPLKIAFPDLKITLMDSLNKRVNFLNEVIKELELTDIYAVHSRAETLARDKEHRQQYDLVVSRAVANMTVLSELCLPYLKVGGSFICYKSDKADEELTASRKAVDLLGGKHSGCKEFILPETDIPRRLYVIDKINDTPDKYPRKEGTPARSPLY